MQSAAFFVLRTPLLPFDVAVRLSEGLEAPAALGEPQCLEGALGRDRARVQARLQTLVETPAIRDALFVASPDLDRAVTSWSTSRDHDRAAATERALIRYVIRMASRATPFGLFAGSGVGMIGEQTQLIVSAQDQCRRHTRLDMDYVVLLADALGRDPALASSIRYTANSSLYRAAGRWRYVETRRRGNVRSHHLVALDDSEALAATLERAHDGATRATLAAALVDEEIDESEADAFVGELIESQILVPDIECPLTGVEPLAHVEAVVRRCAQGGSIADRLAMVASELQEIDRAGLGASPARYRDLAAHLDALPAKVDLTRLFQVDLVRPAASASLGGDVLDDMLRGVEILRRLSPPIDHDQLRRFRTAFAERYEGREVPLVEALDEESGVGSALVEDGDRDASLLLRGLDFPLTPSTTTPWGRRESGLLARVGQALRAGHHEMALTPRDIDELANADAPPLPDAFSVMATLIACDPQAVGRDARVLLHSAGGPSGAALLGRFCHADAELLAHVAQHLRDEEALDADAVFAEIVHLPEGRLGNILLRPVLRNAEIIYLGRSGLPSDLQIAVTDLTVALVEGRFVLRSHRLGRRVIPRLTTAHNFSRHSLGLYRFLCLLQAEGRLAGCHWTWGALAALPFLPRVTCGRLVFSRAQWRVTQAEIRTLNTGSGTERYVAVQSWRASRGLPRWIVLADFDNTLPVDLDNVMAVEAWLQLLKSRDEATVTELYPGPDELCASGPDGRYAHEVLVPFHGRAITGTPAQVGEDKEPHQWSAARVPAVRRTFAPGTEWIYAKLYAGTGSADRLLTEVVGPVSRRLMANGSIDGWFFIRYSDPDDHVRWRLHVASPTRAPTVRRRVEEAAAILNAAGHVRRLVFDTYDREVERYGGPAGIAAAEQYFCADSETVLDILAVLGSGDATADLRWQVAIASVDALLVDLGLDLEARLLWTQQLRDSFGREFHVDASLRRQLAAKFRTVRADLNRLISPVDGLHSPSMWRDALTERSTRGRPALAALQASAQAGSLSCTIPQLARSFAHMHLNRLFRAQQRAHELVIYDFLACLYEARHARWRLSAK